MKHVLILEDNENSLEALTRMVLDIDINTHVCQAKTLEEAFRSLFEYRIDLFLLDIILTTRIPGDISGIKFAQQVRENEKYLFTPIIFITALADPELYAYRNLHSFGYLEKPVSMKAAKELIGVALKYQTPEPEKKIIYFRKDGILVAVDFMKVIYAEIYNRVLSIHMKEDTLEIPYITIKQLKKQCEKMGFVQCSRNSIVNRKYISSIDLVSRYIQLLDGTRIGIGPAYVKKLNMSKGTNFDTK